MKATISFLSVLFCFSLFGQTNTLVHEWTKTFGSTGIDRCYDVVSDSGDDLYFCGRFEQTVDFDPSSNVFNLTSPNGTGSYVCRFSDAGQLKWAVAFTGNGDVRVVSIDLNSQGDIFVTGEFTGTVDFDPGPNSLSKTSNGIQDVFLLKLDPNGNLVWAHSFGGNDRDLGYSLHAYSNNLILLGGKFSGTVDFDPGSSSQVANGSNSENFFLSAFDANGNLLWNNAFLTSNNSTDYASLYSINKLQNGNLIVCGSFFGTVDFDPSSATFNLNSNGNEDSFLASYDPNGNYLWAKSWGGSSEDISTSLAVDPHSNIYVGGSYRGVVDFDPSSALFEQTSTNTYRDIYISKFDQNGNLLWNKAVGGSNTQNINRLTTDPLGNVYAVGYTFSSFDANPDSNKTAILAYRGNADIFLWGLDSAGQYLNSFSIGNTAYDNARGLLVSNQNKLYVSGDFNLSVDFDPSSATATLNSNGSMDAFLQKISICQHSRDSINAFGCQYYISPGGKFFNAPGTYLDTIINQSGCDSLLTINLQLNQLSTAVTTGNQGNSLQANANQTASYQWLDCNNNYSPIQGATSAIFVPTQNGSYAVEVTQTSCKDTSSCHQILSVGLNEGYNTQKISLYPNPSRGTFFLNGLENQTSVACSIYNLSGKLIHQFTLNAQKQFKLDEAEGIYFLQIQLKNGSLIRKKLVIH
ncbi:MAG: T9SS type A sorting domain-containing protein [Vicingaceae bacterium]